MNIESAMAPLFIVLLFGVAAAMLVAMQQRYPKIPGAVLLCLHATLLLFAGVAGAYLQREDVYYACRNEGWYLVQGSGDLYQRRAIECTGWNGQEVEDAAREAFNRGAM